MSTQSAHQLSHFLPSTCAHNLSSTSLWYASSGGKSALNLVSCCFLHLSWLWPSFKHKLQISGYFWKWILQMNTSLYTNIVHKVYDTWKYKSKKGQPKFNYLGKICVLMYHNTTYFSPQRGYIPWQIRLFSFTKCQEKLHISPSVAHSSTQLWSR
jgi:hypothetical protein